MASLGAYGDAASSTYETIAPIEMQHQQQVQQVQLPKQVQQVLAPQTIQYQQPIQQQLQQQQQQHQPMNQSFLFQSNHANSPPAFRGMNMGMMMPSSPSQFYPGLKQGTNFTTSTTELLWERRRDAAKLALMSLVILLAISMHSTVWFYIKEFIEMYPSLTYAKELGIRVGYPILVFVIMWYVKIALTR